VLSERVATALSDGAPVVALESTIITHGLPHPENVRAAMDFERTVADSGAVPPTIAVLDGVVQIGVEADQLERLAGAESALKLSARDLPVALARGASGGTTVAATALLASHAGISVFATGGIGGVHRNASETFDESVDLGILGSCPITVVSAGVKSILDIRATLERLETLSVTVLVFGTRQFPAFWLADSGISVDFSVSNAADVADVMRAARALGNAGGILVANPLPESAQLDRDVHDRLLTEALEAAQAASVTGKDITPSCSTHPLPYGGNERGRQSRDRAGQLPAGGTDRGGVRGRGSVGVGPAQRGGANRFTSDAMRRVAVARFVAPRLPRPWEPMTSAMWGPLVCAGRKAAGALRGAPRRG
jgi:pseudouridine-5'-phosphate glycosidase